MNCEHCASWNAEDEHRCTRCGRRLKASGTNAVGYPASRSAPAFAFAEQPAVVVEVREPARLLQCTPFLAKVALHQFAGSNVIPFESFAADRIEPIAFPATPATGPIRRRRQARGGSPSQNRSAVGYIPRRKTISLGSIFCCRRPRVRGR